MSPVFMIINWTQLFFIPALTMRSIAEENRNGTIELLLTKPIKIMELIWSKFSAYLLISTVAILLTIPYYITIATLGDVDHGTVLLGYLGLIAISSCYISIGLFASSLTRSTVSAFFISLGIALCFQLLFGMLAEQIGNHFIASVFSYLSIMEHFDTLSRGIFDSRDLIYFGSITALFLALSKFFICRSRF
jgi:ABC-2 type transport system permease protein